MVVLKSNQKAALKYALKVQHPAFFMEQRLRKTTTFIRWSLMQKEQGPRLVVTPFSAWMDWETDLKREGQNSPVFLDGPVSRRLKRLAEGLEQGKKWFIMNYEGHRSIPAVADIEWDFVILDESTYIKNPTAKMTKYYMKHFRDVPHRAVLTGTPDPDSELDYVCQLQFLDRNILNVKDYWEFRHKYCRMSGFDWVLSAAGKKFLYGQLARYCFFQQRSEWNLGGEKVHSVRLVQLDKKAQRAYNGCESDFVLDYDGEEINKTNLAIGRFGWLHRLTGGFIDNHMVARAKWNELKKVLEGEFKGRPVVIWCWYTAEIEWLYSQLVDLGYACGMLYGDVKRKDREMVVRGFRLGTLDCLICQYRTMRMGVNFSLSKSVINYSMATSPLSYQQAMDRTISIEENENTHIISLLAIDTIDIDMYEGLQARETKQQILRRCVGHAKRRGKYA